MFELKPFPFCGGKAIAEIKEFNGLSVDRRSGGCGAGLNTWNRRADNDAYRDF